MAFKKNMKAKIAVTAMIVFMASSLCACGGGYMDPVEDWMSFVNERKTDYNDISSIFNPSFSSKELASLEKLAKDCAEDDFEAALEGWADALEGWYDDTEDEFEGWKISFEKKNAKEIKSKDLKEYNEYIEDFYDNREDVIDEFEDILEDDDDLEDFADELDVSEKKAKKCIKAMIKYMKAYEDIEATKGYEVKGKFILKSDGDEYKTKTMSFIVLKIDGSWVYWGLSDYSYNDYYSLGFEEDDEGVFYLFFSRLLEKGFYNPDFPYFN